MEHTHVAWKFIPSLLAISRFISDLKAIAEQFISEDIFAVILFQLKKK